MGAEDGEAHERFGSAFDRYGGAGAGSGVGTTGVYMDGTRPEEFEGEG